VILGRNQRLRVGRQLRRREVEKLEGERVVHRESHIEYLNTTDLPIADH
jgi:hypothetical protein